MRDLDPSKFAQYQLFSFEEIATVGAVDEGVSSLEPTEAPLGARVRRSRLYDEGIMRWIAYHRWVTLHQVLWRHFVYAGKATRPGFRVVQQLVDRGLVRSELLNPEKGSVSKSILSLTDEGWVSIGVAPPATESSRANPLGFREYKLQFAEAMLQRNAEGWRFVRAEDMPTVLREVTLAAFRGRTLTDTERLFRDRVERAQIRDFPLWGLVHRGRHEVRLGLSVRAGRSVAALLEKLPTMAAFSPLTFEVVGADSTLLSKAHLTLNRWAEAHKIRVETMAVENFRARPHPAKAPLPRVDRYAEFGLPSPQDFLS